jgi:hypothetical protein
VSAVEIQRPSYRARDHSYALIYLNKVSGNAQAEVEFSRICQKTEITGHQYRYQVPVME